MCANTHARTHTNTHRSRFKLLVDMQYKRTNTGWGEAPDRNHSEIQSDRQEHTQCITCVCRSDCVCACVEEDAATLTVTVLFVSAALLLLSAQKTLPPSGSKHTQHTHKVVHPLCVCVSPVRGVQADWQTGSLRSSLEQLSFLVFSFFLIPGDFHIEHTGLRD